MDIEYGELYEHFKVGCFGQNAVEESEWHDPSQTVRPVFLEEKDIHRIREALYIMGDLYES